MVQSRGGRALMLVVGGWVGVRLIVLAVAHGGVQPQLPAGLPGLVVPPSGGVAMVPLLDALGGNRRAPPMLADRESASAPPPLLEAEQRYGRQREGRQLAGWQSDRRQSDAAGAGAARAFGGGALALAFGLGNRIQALGIARLTRAGRDRDVSAMLEGMVARFDGARFDAVPTQIAPPGFMADGARAGAGPVSNRWALDIFAFFRGGATPGAAPGSSGPGAGILGGTQHGAILRYRIDQRARFEAFVRLTSVGDPPRGEAVAAGIAVHPLRAVPLRIIAERRQRIGDAGRSGTALYVVGGGRVQAGRWQVDGYGAGGIVGARRREAFAEGAARATTSVLRMGHFDLAAGAGSWAAAQRGVARVDVGPSLVMRARGPVAPTLALDWRTRIAGDARPARGAALTVSMNF